MKQFLILFSCIILSTKSNTLKAQTVTMPIKWKVGQTFRYELKHKGIGSMMMEEFNSNKAFQIKVLSQNAKSDSSYIIEWRYISFVTFMTDTLKEEFAVAEKKFILKTPFRFRLDKKGKWQNFADTTDIKRQMIDFYKIERKTAREPGGFDFKISQINEWENFGEYLDAILPEIKVFYSAYDLFPASVAMKKDTIETFNDYILEYNKMVSIPKILSSTSKYINPNLLKISNFEKLNESALKKYFSESTRAAWDKMKLKKDNPARVANEKMLDDFQPKLSNNYEALFDNQSSTPIKFDYLKEEWMMLRGGSSWYYSFKRL
ncbi:hypothetical protein P1X15_32360 [Runella sp. MFBS21]|uniref:hypothetical protein n=1 Tax=Runella sp. MFBS21 TaxID=3034018 RepID=UPI0023F65312|nr:hypothetical protein [Runella sp. MFBS21]MDF7822348.1 hypothetical protein [Runella sp. MFBS21]